MRGHPGKLLEPLIVETFKKALEIGPQKAQTGPAIRKDDITIRKHLEMLKGEPDMQDLYRRISESIGFPGGDQK
jgi:hypothetical protein